MVPDDIAERLARIETLLEEVYKPLAAKVEQLERDRNKMFGAVVVVGGMSGIGGWLLTHLTGWWGK